MIQYSVLHLQFASKCVSNKAAVDDLRILRFILNDKVTSVKAVCTLFRNHSRILHCSIKRLMRKTSEKFFALVCPA